MTSRQFVRKECAYQRPIAHRSKLRSRSRFRIKAVPLDISTILATEMLAPIHYHNIIYYIE